MMQSPADDHWAEDSSEIRSDIYNVFINDLDDETAHTFSKPATDTKPGQGQNVGEQGYNLKGLGQECHEIH